MDVLRCRQQNNTWCCESHKLPSVLLDSDLIVLLYSREAT